MKKTFKIRLPELTEWQSDAFHKIKCGMNTGRNFVIKSPRQVGKTYFLKYVLTYYALKFAGSKSVIIEPVGYAARRIQREMFKSLKKTRLLESNNMTDGLMVFRNGSELHFHSAEQGDSLRGLTVSGILILDEAAFITDDVYDICLPFCNVWRAPKLIVSSPLFKQGFFFNEFSDEDNTVFDWNRDDYDFSRFLSEEDYKRYLKKYTKAKFTTEVLGEFIEAWSEVFGNFKACVCTPDDMTPVYGGLDWSTGSDNDETVLTLMNKDRQVVYRWATADTDPVAQVNIIASIINSFPMLKGVYVEENSIGKVYLSMLRKAVRNQAVIHSHDTTNEQKREIVEDLIVAFEQRNIGIDNDPMLHAQLAGFQIKKLKKGYTYGNDKDSTHDDRVDSLAFCYYMFKPAKTGTVGFSKR